MALPQLKNDVPKYEMTVPSTGEVVKDQSGPFISVVGEEGARVIPFAHISRIEFSNPRKSWG